MTTDPDPALSRDALLEASLAHVLFDGWSRTALVAGGRSIGLDDDAVDRIFPGGGIEARLWLDDWADRRMIERLRSRDLSAMPLPQRVAAGLKARLAALGPHREAVRRALAARLSPVGAVQAAQAVYRTVDAIWWEVGDQSTDFSFYTKRGILAAIHSAAVLYWLGDTSEGDAETEAFIDRRMADIGRLPALRRRVEEGVRRWRAGISQIRREARL